ncbi:siderophore-interacting protein, partial [Pseudomonas aeruginosa]
MKTLAADQRIKIFVPDASGQPPSLPGGSEWYQAYRSVEPARRPPMRTYTIRALRAEQEEVDVEFVLHGENGPASAWATHARIGDRLQLAAPNRQYGDDPGGYEWKPPAGVRHILLIADETALPAVAGILEELAGETEPPVVEAFLEVPGEADILDLPAIPAARLHWLPRHQAGIHSRNGERMIEAARQARLPEREVAGGAAQELEDIDIDEEILWELASPESGSFYAWVAGESAAVMAIRRYLVQERGIDKRHLTLMGYWRLGKVFD